MGLASEKQKLPVLLTLTVCMLTGTMFNVFMLWSEENHGHGQDLTVQEVGFLMIIVLWVEQ